MAAAGGFNSSGCNVEAVGKMGRCASDRSNLILKVGSI
ncbi:hypothetical protein RintRC_3115 [Richelia intracellularis]|nr:hypothetical protein RintRC_3115 [Richelia intracellularis]